MLTRTEAVEMSTKKWELLSLGKHSDPDCGFCEYQGEHKNNDPTEEISDDDLNCIGCPLYPDICSNFISCNLFWNYTKSKVYSEPDKKLELAKQMLAVIKERGAKWIEGETNAK